MYLWLVFIVFLLISPSTSLLKDESFLQSTSIFNILLYGKLKCSKLSQETNNIAFLINQGSEEMASSQVEIASSSSSFGHVLRDRNRRDRCTPRDSNAFQKNLKDLVNTHIHSCISSSQPTIAPNSSDSNENSNSLHRHVDYADLWVHKPQWDNNENNPTNNIKSVDKWDRATEMVLLKQRDTSSSYPETTTTVVEVPNSGGVSTLVRRWRDFETVSKSSNPSSAKSNCENAAFADTNDTCDESSVDGRFETHAMSVNGDSSGDWEQAYKTAMNDNNNKDSEKLRVADIIRKLASSNGEENNENENDCSTNAAPLATGECLPRIKTSFDHSEQQHQRSFFPVLHSPRIIRGRQALSDLLLLMERDRLRELETLRERKAVSKFQQRGRIQALLKVRFLRRARDDRSTNGTSSESNRGSNSGIMHIRERFNTGRQNGGADSRSLSRETAENIQESQNSTLNQQKVQNCDKENKVWISCHSELADNNAVKVGSELASYKQRERNQKQEIIRGSTGMQPGVDTRSSSSPKSEIASTSTRENHPEPSDPMTPRITLIDNNSLVGKVLTSNQLQEENYHGEVNEKISPLRMTTNVKVTSSSNPQTEMPFHIRHSDSSCSPNHNEVVSPSLLHCTSQLQSSDISHDQANCENASCQDNHDKSLEFLETSRSPKDCEQSVHREEEDANNLQHAGTSNEWSSESTKPQSDWEEEVTNQNLVDSDCGWVSDYSHTPSGWDELQSNYQQQSESNQDWVSDISRPREEWEDLRQARYQEMLDPFIENHDIRQLLNSKSVSIFLNSGLREKIDRLMTSRSQQLPSAMSGQLEERVGAHMTKEEGKEEEVRSHNETRAAEGEDDEEEADSGYEDDFEDDNTPIRQQYLEPEELVDQSNASQTFQSWSNNQDLRVSDDSYHLPSNSLPQPQLSNIYSQHNQQSSSSTRHSSIEMELIYELRGHMEQLHQEIFEIRRSINSCMNMQVKLQHSIKQEVAAAITQSGPMIGSKKGAKIANCCICYEAQVDSLLYRCGHMCTCFRCAHELLWGTGKCPICETPIIDVVRAHIHS